MKISQELKNFLEEKRGKILGIYYRDYEVAGVEEVQCLVVISYLGDILESMKEFNMVFYDEFEIDCEIDKEKLKNFILKYSYKGE